MKQLKKITIIILGIIIFVALWVLISLTITSIRCIGVKSEKNIVIGGITVSCQKENNMNEEQQGRAIKILKDFVTTRKPKEDWIEEAYNKITDFLIEVDDHVDNDW